MSSIRNRMTLLYAAAATLSSAVLFVAGHTLLEGLLIHGLDELNTAEFHQLKAHLGQDYRTLSASRIDQRIRETTEFGSVLFYISVDYPHTGIVFTSHNLGKAKIPDVKGKHNYNVQIANLGEVRASEFVLPPFDVTVATPMRQVRATMRSYIEVCAALLFATLASSIAIGAGLARVILRPLLFIRATATGIGSHNLSARIPVPGNDEIADLARLLNAMFDRLEIAFDQVKRFTSEASHELKTPLSLIRLHAERLLESPALSSTQMDTIVAQLDEVARLNEIIDGLLFLSRAEANAVAIDLKRSDPSELLEGVAQDGAALAEYEGKYLDFHPGPARQVAMNARWLRQAWLNLITNAIRASPPGGHVTLRSSFGGGHWSVVVEDEGPGLDDAQIETAFERFTRFSAGGEEDRGSGLGLAIVRSIITLHKGTVTAARRSDRSGLSVSLVIPSPV